jgi:hypothetical protein
MVRGLVGVDVGLPVRDEAARAKDVIRVVVGVDEGRYRLAADLLELGLDGAGALDAAHRVDDEDTIVSLDHDRVGEPEPDRLMDAVGDLVDLPLELRCVGGEPGVDVGRRLGRLLRNLGRGRRPLAAREHTQQHRRAC